MPGGLPSKDDPAEFDAGDFGMVGAGASTLVNNTQSSVENFYRGQVQGNSAWGSASEFLFDGLEALLGFPIAFAKKIAEMLMGVVIGGVEFIGDVFDALSVWSNDVIEKTRIALNQIGDVLHGMVVVPVSTAVQNVVDWFAGLLGFQENTESTQTNLQNFQISAITSGQRNPTWVSRYPISDVTYPEIMHTMFPIYGNTGSASGGTAHTHNFLPTFDAWAEPASWVVAPDEAVGGYITTQYGTVYDTVGMILRKTGGGSINNVFIETFRETASGGLERIAFSNIASSLSTSGAYIERDLPGVIAQSGERYVVRLRNSSTVANNVELAGTYQHTFAFDYSMKTGNATDTAKTTITPSEAATFRAASREFPWAVLAAVNLAETDQSFSDDFNRSAIGGLWSLRSDTGVNQLRISGNKAVFGGTADGVQHGLYVRPTAGDAMRVEFDISNTGGSPSGAQSGGLLCCNRDLTQVVYLAVNHVGSKIYSGAWNALTERATDTESGDGRWAFYYDVALNKFVALKNGSATGLEWTDTGLLMSHSRDFRYGGIRVARNSFFNSPALDNWTLRDWTP